MATHAIGIPVSLPHPAMKMCCRGFSINVRPVLLEGLLAADHNVITPGLTVCCLSCSIFACYLLAQPGAPRGARGLGLRFHSVFSWPHSPSSTSSPSRHLAGAKGSQYRHETKIYVNSSACGTIPRTGVVPVPWCMLSRHPAIS